MNKKFIVLYWVVEDDYRSDTIDLVAGPFFSSEEASEKVTRSDHRVVKSRQEVINRLDSFENEAEDENSP